MRCEIEECGRKYVLPQMQTSTLTQLSNMSAVSNGCLGGGSVHVSAARHRNLVSVGYGQNSTISSCSESGLMSVNAAGKF